MVVKEIVLHEGHKVGKDFILMTLPLFIMSAFFYGPRVLALALAAYVTAVVCDRFSCMLKNTKYNKTENSSKFFALVIVLLMPASVPFYVVVSAVAVAIFIGKEAFGGYRSYPFNPAAVGACVAAVSWPEQVLRYPAPSMWLLNGGFTWENIKRVWDFSDVPLSNGVYSALSQGNTPNVSGINLVLGNFAGPLGMVPVLVILACAIYLLARKSLNIYTPLTFLLTCAFIAFFFPRISAVELDYTFSTYINLGLQSLLYEILSGIIPFAAVFMVAEEGTLPKNTASQLLYGALIGFATMMFNYFGSFELGACFALILVNAISGYFDRMLAKYSGRKYAKNTK